MDWNEGDCCGRNWLKERFQQRCRELLHGKTDYICTVRGMCQIMAGCICVKKSNRMRVDSDGLDWYLLAQKSQLVFGGKNEYVKKRKYLPARSCRLSDRNLWTKSVYNLKRKWGKMKKQEKTKTEMKVRGTEKESFDPLFFFFFFL